MGEILITLIISIACLGGWYLINNADKNKLNKDVKKVKNRIYNLGFTEDKIKFGLYGGLNSCHAVLTNEDQLYIITPNGVDEKINLNDILNIKIDLHVSEKNTRRIVAFTSTYDKRTEVQGVDVKLMTCKDSYTIRYMNGEHTPFGIPYENMVDKSERFKLIIEKLIKEAKSY